MSELLKSIEGNTHVDGVILDLYTASFYNTQLQKYRIQKVFEDVHSYGFVLRTRTIVLQRCLVQYMLTTQREIYNDIRKKFPPLKVRYFICCLECFFRVLPLGTRIIFLK